MNPLLAAGIAAVAVLFLTGALALSAIRSRRLESRSIEMYRRLAIQEFELRRSGLSLQDRSPDIAADAEAQTREAALAKKKLLTATNIKMFLYLDEGQVVDLYAQVVPQYELRQMTIGEHGSGEVGGKLQLPGLPVGFHASGTRGNDVTSVIVPAPVEPANKFNQVFQHLVSQDQVLFGLEDFSVPQVTERILKEVVRTVSRMGIVVEESDLQPVVARNNRSLAETGLAQFASNEGRYVAMDTRWTAEAQDIAAAITMRKDIALGPLTVNIRTQLPTRGRTNRLELAIVPGKELRATVFGSILRWDKEDSSLVIQPIAVY